MLQQSFLCVGALSCAFASGALADTVLGIDVNNLEGSASGVSTGSPFSSQFAATYTGTFTVFDIIGGSTLTDVSLNGLTRPFFFTPALFDVTGTIDIVGNTVDGGSFSIVAWNDALHATGKTEYSVSIKKGVGSLTHMVTVPGNDYRIEGLTFGGMFLKVPGPGTSTTFAGADVSAFTAVQPLLGSFEQFLISMNDTTGSFVTSQLDVVIVIPLPGSAGLALAGMFGLGFVRRRR